MFRSSSAAATLLSVACLAGIIVMPAGCAPPARNHTAIATGEPKKTTADPARRPGSEAPKPPRTQSDDEFIRQNYAKREYHIPMRDGVKLFTAVYTPTFPTDKPQKYPFMMVRTPYSVGPYGEGSFPGSLGPSMLFAKDGFIFVYQDVRGRFMSEGEFVNMTPHVEKPNTRKDRINLKGQTTKAQTSGGDTPTIDESTDTYDTIEWLLANIPNNSGKVGQWGISYPGFYASAGMIDAHPALKAVSPQAPIADWFFDDFFHHGAFFLPHAFNFFAGFGQPRPAPTTQWSGGVEHGTPDGYNFFMNMGPLKNADTRYYKGNVAFWNEICLHPNYDEFWQKRNLLPHLKNVAPAVMVVGGWFDAEDLYGALNTYTTIEKQNPGVFNMLVMGPWRHGGWARSDGASLGNAHFAGKPSLFYRENIEFPFFSHHLKGKGEAGSKLPEAYVYETGSNQWRKFDVWPPKEMEQRSLYLCPGERLSFESPSTKSSAAAEKQTEPDPGFDEYVSDPRRPVPFTEAINIGMTAEYMTDDQRFASRRPDVLVYQTPPLESDLTLAGPITADLWVSTSGGDSDWVVKLIDVFPGDAPDPEGLAANRHMGDYQMMVRSEIIRGRFRDSYERPTPFEPNVPTRVNLPLQDVLHTFEKGHRVMVQIQSTWFPLVDRNPQTYVPNIFQANDSDFIKATQRVYRSAETQTRLRVGVIKSRP